MWLISYLLILSIFLTTFVTKKTEITVLHSYCDTSLLRPDIQSDRHLPPLDFMSENPNTFEQNEKR